MNCGKSRFVDADHTCSRADKIVCRSSYKINKRRFTVSAFQFQNRSCKRHVRASLQIALYNKT